MGFHVVSAPPAVIELEFNQITKRRTLIGLLVSHCFTTGPIPGGQTHVSQSQSAAPYFLPKDLFLFFAMWRKGRDLFCFRFLSFIEIRAIYKKSYAIFIRFRVSKISHVFPPRDFSVLYVGMFQLKFSDSHASLHCTKLCSSPHKCSILNLV